jgi:8-oxo-dGTP pyrophosphatase MutT (NUDIX family)
MSDDSPPNTRHTVIPRTMCFIVHEEEILFLKASQEKDWSGKYNLIGGHIEQDEDIIASANREILEETGLNVTDTKLAGIVHVNNFFNKNILMFVTFSHATSKQVINNHEGTLEWIHKDDVTNLNTFADVKPIFDQVLAHPNQVFSATSKFNDTGDLIQLVIR